MSDASRYDLKKENKGVVDNALDFPKLKLEKKGEVARIAIIGLDRSGDRPALAVPAPEGGYFFDLRIPGAERDWRGAYECIAPEETKRAEEFDAATCPHCALVTSGVSEDVVGQRRRRFVLPVVRYRTKPGSSDLLEPKACEVIAWVFTDRYFNELVDANAKWSSPAGAENGLLSHDITLTCEVVQFQNFRFSVEPNAEWREDQVFGKQVLQTLIGSLDLVPAGLRRKLGTTLSAEQLDVKLKAHMVEAGQSTLRSEPLAEADQAEISSLADDLFGGPTVAAAAAEDAAAAADDAAAEAAEAPAAAEAAEAPAVDVAAAADSDPVDFDAFFDS